MQLGITDDRSSCDGLVSLTVSVLGLVGSIITLHVCGWNSLN